jgi:uncharacterized membrane protein HdeD (DUF308 family)
MTYAQMQAAPLLLLGIASFILSAGVAWALSRVSHTRRVENAWLIVVGSFVLLAAGIIFCWFGVSALVEG